MNAEHLLTHFDRLADAPDAIPRLRRFILDLAVRGKLVEQDPEDKPAGELLKRIAEEKAHLVKAGKIRKQDTEAIAIEEYPYKLPLNWIWSRLGAIGDWGSGSTPRRGGEGLYGGGITWLKSGELNDDPRLSGSEETVTKTAVEKGTFRGNQPGDVLIAMYGATIGKVAILAEYAVTNQAVCGCTPFSGVFNQFLFLYLKSQKENFQTSSEGGAQPNISKAKIVGTPFPLPPLAEQHRIVAKVDGLMALCDRLETVRKEREATRNRLATASLARLNAPDPDPAVLQNHAAFALNNLTPLTTRPDQIKALRQTILNLAVRGRLVEQDPEDEPAGELLKRIATHREATAKAATVRFKKPVAPATDATPVDLPDGWAIEALANLVNPTAKISYGVLVPGPDVEDGIPFVRTQDLYLSGHPDRPSKKISPEIEASYARTRLRGGEILLCVVGSIGKLGIVPRAWIGANIARAVARIAPVEQLSSGYLLLSLRYEQSQSYFTDTTRTLAQPTLNVGLIEKLPIPLPPLAEQHRIVAKVDELMALCDRLEAGLAAGDETRGRLVEAMLRETLATGRPEV